MANTVELIQGIVAVLGSGALVGLGSWYLRNRAERHAQRLEEGGFWVGHSTAEFLRLQQTIEDQNRDLKEVRGRYDEQLVATGAARTQVESLMVRMTAVMAENEMLKAGFGPPGMVWDWLRATLIVDDRAVIVKATPSVALLFSWFETDLVGRPITDIMAVPNRDRVGMIFGYLREHGCLPEWTAAYDSVGLTKTGMEIPVTMNLSAWAVAGTGGKAHWFVAVMIQRRYDGGGVGVEWPTDAAG